MRRLVLLPLLAACGRPRCDAEPTDAVRTALRATWEAPGDDPAHVDYGVDGDLDLSTPERPDGSALLLGLPPLTSVSYAVSAGHWTCEGRAKTGNLPADLPELTLRADDPAIRSDEPYVLGAILGEPAALFAVDRAGSYVWYAEMPADRQVAEAYLSEDRQFVLHNEFALEHDVDEGVIRRLRLDGEPVEEIRTEGAHHVFAELPDGTLAWVSIDVREAPDPVTGATVPIVGDRILERAPDGEVRELWSSWDWLPVRRGDTWDGNFYPQGRDWTHANGLRYDAASDSWLLTLGHLRTVVQVSRSTGEPLRTMGVDGEYPVAAGSRPMVYPHDGHLIADDRLLVFTSTEDRRASGAIEYAIDDDAHELREVWSYGLDGDEPTPLLGQATRLRNGNTLVNFGGIGILREVTPEGEVAWELRTRLGSWFGNVHPLDDFYAR